MSKKYIYVASGIGFTRITLKQMIENQETQQYISDCFRLLRTHYEDQDFGILFNAFVEKKFGPIFQDYYKKDVYGIYADSGGLQAITLGKEVTPEFKTNIFNIQKKYSDYAMSFDDIPVTVTSNESKRGSELSTRFYDKTKLEECAMSTALSLKEQINIFMDKPESTTKPFLIIQGSDEESYTRWTDVCLSVLTDKEAEQITSIAIGAASLGNGRIEDMDKTFYFNQIKHKFNTENVHYLAHGSVNRLLPIALFSDSFLKDLNISFDSTTHTMAPYFGNYNDADGNSITYTRNLDDNTVKVYNDVKRNIPFYSKTLEEFHQFVHSSLTKSTDPDETARSTLSYIISCIMNFQTTLHNIKSSNKVLENIVGRDYPIYKELKKVTDAKEYLEWRDKVARYMPSRRISTQKTETFGDLI